MNAECGLPREYYQLKRCSRLFRHGLASRCFSTLGVPAKPRAILWRHSRRPRVWSSRPSHITHPVIMRAFNFLFLSSFKFGDERKAVVSTPSLTLNVLPNYFCDFMRHSRERARPRSVTTINCVGPSPKSPSLFGNRARPHLFIIRLCPHLSTLGSPLCFV